MKFVFLLGGFVGFALAIIAGLGAHREASLVLRDAAIGCLIGGLLFRWFWLAVVRALNETALERRREAAADPATSPAAPDPARSR